MKENKTKLTKINIINALMGITSKIRTCYSDLAEIELSLKDGSIEDVYAKIREYRGLEDFMYSSLSKLCNSKKDVDEIYDYIDAVYPIIYDDSFLLSYFKNCEHYKNIESIRVSKRIDKEIFIDQEENDEDDDKDNILVIPIATHSDIPVTSNSELSIKNMTLRELIATEDIINFVERIDSKNLEDTDKDEFLLKRELLKLKYDMFFLNDDFESMLVEDCCYLSSSLVNAKEIAASVFDMNDEEVDREYDIIRENEIFKITEELSQWKNRDCSDVRTNLIFILIEMIVDSLSDKQFAIIMEKLSETIDKSYNEEIFESRYSVYRALYTIYEDNINSVTDKENKKSNVKRKKKNRRNRNKKK